MQKIWMLLCQCMIEQNIVTIIRKHLEVYGNIIQRQTKCYFTRI